MTTYNRTVLDEIETRLCMQYDQVREDILAQTHQSDDPEIIALANHNDDCDWTEADLQGDTDIARLRQQTRQLHDIEIALNRIKAGTYGVCAGCGNPIPAARMQAQITSEYCLDFQGKLEKNTDFRQLKSL